MTESVENSTWVLTALQSLSEILNLSLERREIREQSGNYALTELPNKLERKK